MVHRVAVLALDEVVGLDLPMASQILGEARRDGRPLYDVRVCGVERSVRVTSGYRIELDHGPEALAEADTVIVPGTQHVDPAQQHAPPLGLDGTRHQGGQGRLAGPGATHERAGEAGRHPEVDAGRRATTHWARAADFRRLFPAVELDEDVLFVDEGDLLTSAGLAAGIDLCLHVLRRDHGSDVANAVARYSVVAPWRDGGQAQFIAAPVPEGRIEGGTAAARAWAMEHLDEPIAVADLAAACAMRVRTFTRRFRAETGRSPAAWLLAQRLARARHLLETTTLPVDRVAAGSGLGSASSLRAHLGASLGVSPLAYRRLWVAPSRR